MIAAICASAPATYKQDWNTINWCDVEKHVRRLQMRIAKAFREKKYGKAKALQWLLTHSYQAKLLAVRRVTKNSGAKTPGVDQVTWKTPKQKMQAASSLTRRGYSVLPLRRIYIPKKQTGKMRPLSIPAMKCRAMQALYLLALEPIAEMMADKNTYGFRILRSPADAVSQCFSALAKRTSSEYILEADIQSCFDNISHEWLLKNIPMDKIMLKKWLHAGYMINDEIYPTKSGTPQGSIISPTLLVITLSGMERAVNAVISNKKKNKNKVHFSIYADDFIITGATREVLEGKVKPVVENFLHERGLSLSKEKTRITYIKEGFDFLGMNIRRYDSGKLIIKPAKENVKSFLAEIRTVIKSNRTSKTENLIRQLNPKISGWTNYFRHVCAKSTFSHVSHCIFGALWQWAQRRHPDKSKQWVRKKYFRSSQTRKWIFSVRIKQPDGKANQLDLIDAALVRIRRHIKIKSDATPYDPTFVEYFSKRVRCKTYTPKGVSYT